MTVRAPARPRAGAPAPAAAGASIRPLALDAALLAGLVALYIALAAAYALALPRWYAPDEPAHFNYIRHLAETGTLPILEPGDFPASYLDSLKSAKPPFPREASIERIRYEAHQPPLYYALAAAAYRLLAPALGDDVWLGLRFVSVALGALLVPLVWAAARLVWPEGRLLPLAAAAAPVAVPMHVAMTAAINNDTLAEVVLAALALALARGVVGGFGRRLTVVCGLLLGLCLLTKLVDYVAVGLVPVALLLRGWLDRRGDGGSAGVVGPAVTELRSGRFWRLVVLAFAVASVVAGWWFLRAALVYGPTDLLGLVRHDAVMGEEPRTYQYVEQLGLARAFQRWAATLSQSFWAQFGWMSILIEQWEYALLNALTALAAAGAVLGALRWARGAAVLPPRRAAAFAMLVLVALAVVSTVVYYNIRFWQPQGRYLFPAIGPLGLLFALGLRELFAPRYRPLLFGLLLTSLFMLHIACLRQYIPGFFRL